MSEDAEQQEIIIVRRHGAHEDGHHGGAWKIAYADFVTAMMAFFLVLWILNSTNKDSQTIIARYFNPVKMEDFAKNKRGIRDEKPTDDKPPVNEGEPDMAPPQGQQQGKMEQKGKEPLKDINAKALMNEDTLFQNPYAALEQIAGKAPMERKNKAGSAAEAGSADAYRDPFRAAEGAADDAEEPEDETPPAPPAPSGGKSESPVKAESAKPGQKTAQTPAQTPAQQAAAAEAAQEAAEKADAEALQKQLAVAAKDEIGDNQPRFEVKATREGLLISLTDNDKFGMFELGSSQPNPKMVHLMERIARMLKNRPGGVVLRGFTDSRPFRTGASDNWRLSASRAQMAQFMLIRGGLDAGRLERIEAYADRKPVNAAKPEAPENRRIEILLRKASS
ncbi:chemotaxis protein MotB [Rhodoblastus acidophilus]|uniref:MotB family protein n=1 Tax=Rhodoblastus acidophilus TaxID=1074 RepID=UPI00222413B2|nr:MotB family protein [Rhodoblastus acidophilus]MCW2284608.1 chemotaxis protein MotB [Rhodoblastus acidophilus]MCW2333561.1 chemotaxis protein MotB [Rhodoblastus acidophilus]